MSEEEFSPIWFESTSGHSWSFILYYMAGSASGRQDEGASVLVGRVPEQERCSGIKLRPALFGRQFKHNENRQQRRLERWSYLFCPFTFGISPALYRKKRFCFGHIINPDWSRLFSQDGWKSWMSASFFFAPVFMDLDDKKVKKKKLASFHPAWPNKLGQN